MALVVQAWEQALLFTLPPQWSIPGNIKAWGISMIASCERCIIFGFPWRECKECGQRHNRHLERSGEMRAAPLPKRKCNHCAFSFSS